MRKPDPKEIAASLGGEPENPDGGLGDEQEPDSDLEAVIADLCDALETKDYKSAAEAFKQAFALLESQPSEEAVEPEPTK